MNLCSFAPLVLVVAIKQNVYNKKKKTNVTFMSSSLKHYLTFFMNTFRQCLIYIRRRALLEIDCQV